MDNSRNYKYSRSSMGDLRNHRKMFTSKDGEEWLFETQAGYSKYYFYTIPGFISLSNKRLVFEPAITSITSSNMIEVSLLNISSIERTNRLILLPNSFKVFVSDGTSHSFITWKREVIFSILNKINP